MGQERAPRAGTAPSTQSLLETLTGEIMRLNPAVADAGIDPDASLLDGGYLDSLTAAELLAAVEVRWGIHVSIDRLVGDLATLRALAAWLEARAR